MTEREKVIAAYICQNEKLPGKRCENCPYGYEYLDQTGDYYFVWCDTDRIMVDAIDLLKAQEPRVMTLEEVRKWEQPDVWMEFRKDGTIEPTAQLGFALIAATVTNSTLKPPTTMADAYGLTWRCWTSRPDQATREAVKWNE